MTGDRMLEILQFYNRAGFLPEVYFTKKGDDLSAVRERMHSIPYLVCSGGDGMVNMMENALLKHGERAVFGYIPAGTTNDFAHSIGIPSELAGQLAASVSHALRSLDGGLLNDRYFMYVAGFGLFTDVSYKTPQNMKNAFGYLAYILQGIKSLSELRPLHLHVTVDEETIEGDFILGMVTNSLSVAGMKTLAQTGTALDDGLLELILIRNPANLVELSELASAVLVSNIESNLIVYRQGKHFGFTGEKLSWTADGEFGGAYEASVIDVVPGRIALRVPETGISKST